MGQGCGPPSEAYFYTAVAEISKICRHLKSRSIPMMDVVMLAIGLGFFALSIAYVYACDEL